MHAYGKILEHRTVKIRKSKPLRVWFKNRKKFKHNTESRSRLLDMRIW